MSERMKERWFVIKGPDGKGFILRKALSKVEQSSTETEPPGIDEVPLPGVDGPLLKKPPSKFPPPRRVGTHASVTAGKYE